MAPEASNIGYLDVLGKLESGRGSICSEDREEPAADEAPACLNYMVVSMNWGVPFVGVLIITPLLSWSLYCGH